MKLRTRASDRDRAIWLGVLILLAALVPAAYVLWFTNDAISTQSAAARQRVLEAYRGQLRLVRSRIDAHWRDVAAQLDGKGDPVSRFTRLTLDEKADGVLVLNPDGSLAFPQ